MFPGIAEVRAWGMPEAAVAHLFCDASGSPPHIAAVLHVDGQCFWTHMPIQEKTISMLEVRNDAQIMALELLSISLGLCTFTEKLANRKVVVHSDNKGAEGATRKGSAKHLDHAEIVHAQWLHATVNHMYLYIKRVPTDDNIADLPSRREFTILRDRGAIEVEPALSDEFLKASTWQVLNERWLR